MEDILRGKTVLVVDDTTVARMVAADMLKGAGMTVLEADNGERARALAGSAEVDAFLLDIQLPDVSGIELCRGLRAIPRYRGAPIIFVTAIDEREILQWALEAGADDFIQKPLHAMVLRRRLANLMQKAALLEQAELMSLCLGRYVSPRTQDIARGFAATRTLPAPLRKAVCVLFTDARAFTEMSEGMEPETVFEILSAHLGIQVDLVYRHGGYIDKYSGDGIMAVFDGEAMAKRCCLCALDIIERSREHAEQFGPGAIRFGVGIHLGDAMIGNLGSSEHLDYTVIGKSVNLAARLCGLANQSIVVSHAVREAVGSESGLAFVAAPPASIRGLRDTVTVYDLQRAVGT